MSSWRWVSRSILWLCPALLGGCNLIFGITTGTSATSVDGGGGGGGATCSPDRVPACNADGGACTPVLIDSEIDAEDPGVTGEDVFFTTGDGDAIHRVRYDGTQGIDILAGNATTRLAILGYHVYWTDYYGASTVKGSDFEGGGLTTIAVMQQGQQIGNNWIAADVAGARVYWTTYAPNALRTTTDGTQQSATMVLQADTTLDIQAPTGVALDATYLYWGDTDGVRRMKIAEIGAAGPPIEDFAFELGSNEGAGTVIMDADRVYWLTGTGDVRSKAKTDPPAQAPLVHLSGSPDPPMGLALDDAFVYWITLSGVVQKAAKTGATVMPVASGPPSRWTARAAWPSTAVPSTGRCRRRAATRAGSSGPRRARDGRGGRPSHRSAGGWQHRRRRRHPHRDHGSRARRRRALRHVEEQHPAKLTTHGSRGPRVCSLPNTGAHRALARARPSRSARRARWSPAPSAFVRAVVQPDDGPPVGGLASSGKGEPTDAASQGASPASPAPAGAERRAARRRASRPTPSGARRLADCALAPGATCHLVEHAERAVGELHHAGARRRRALLPAADASGASTGPATLVKASPSRRSWRAPCRRPPRSRATAGRRARITGGAPDHVALPGGCRA